MIYNLPIYPNSFVGRKNHLHAIGSLLKSEDKRLITLLGPGGIGKTRLAVKIGEQLVSTFQHGVSFIALDAVTDPAQVPLYIGHRLGLKAGFNNSWIETIISYLADKKYLLILDNLEQVLEAVEVVAQILESCAQVKILVTSREILGLPLEVEYPLDSLNRPNSRLFPRPEDLLKFDAVDLFVQKAQSSRPDFQLNVDNATAVVEICQELEGLPLPIELAAARIKLFSPSLILSKLKINADLLKTRSKRVTYRHQSIRNTIQWSYDLLDDQEQEIFQQLAIFRSGFSPAAIEAVCTDHDALEIIESFINKSLIIKDMEVYDVPRFRMLKMIRDFGLEQLQHHPEKEIYYFQFTRYFIHYVEELDMSLRTADTVKWMELLEAEYENLNETLEWLIAHRPQQAGLLGSSFWRFYLFRGFLQEGLQMIHQLLALPLEDGSIKAKLLEGAGTLSHNVGDYLGARESFAHCLTYWEKLQDQEKIVKALNNLGWAEWRIGNYDRTVSYSEKALKISTAINDHEGQTKSLNNLAWISFYQGHYADAEQLHGRILQMHIQKDNLRGIAFAKINLAWAYVKNGKLPQANPMISESVKIFSDLKAMQLLTFSKLIEADYLLESGDLVAAKTLVENENLPNFERIGDRWGIIYSCNVLGQICLAEKALDIARIHLNRAMETSRKAHDKYGRALAGIWLSRLDRELGNTLTTDATLQDSLLLAFEMKAMDLLKEGYFEMSWQAWEKSAHSSAVSYLVVAEYFAERIGNYQFEKFQVSIQPLLRQIRKICHAGMTAFEDIRPEENWQIGTTEFRSRINNLLTRPLAKTPSTLIEPNIPPPATVDDLVSSEVMNDSFYRQVRDLIELHVDNADFSVKQLCKEIGMSHSHVHRKLHELTGQSAGKLIRSVRLAKAKALLSDTDLTITAIAYDSGFRDTDYFYRVFKQVFGMTPREYRMACSRK